MRIAWGGLVLAIAGCGVGPMTGPMLGEVDAGPAVVEVPDAGKPPPGVDAGIPDAGPAGLPVLGRYTHELNAIDVTLVAGPADGLNQPRDVAVNPAAGADVWIVNYADDSMVIVKGQGTAAESKVKKSGWGAVHFMPRPSALAFGAANRLATAHEEDRPTQGSTPFDFMGPTLWPTDASFEGGHASHLDMLHNSPNAVGIAWDRANVYWVFDGYHNAITRYDFAMDHGPAGNDHSDGIITRCASGQVAYVKGVSSGLELDRSSKLLYVADSGNRRIAVLNTAAIANGMGTAMLPNYDQATQLLMPGMTAVTLIDSVTSPLRRPSGLALKDGVLFVGDNETSKLYAFDLQGKLVDWVDLSLIVPAGGLQGIDVDADGRLYVADSVSNRVMRIAAKQ